MTLKELFDILNEDCAYEDFSTLIFVIANLSTNDYIKESKSVFKEENLMPDICNDKQRNDFINDLTNYLLDATNAEQVEAYSMALRTWQHRNRIFDFMMKYYSSELISENTDDGYHTFTELYHHRAILFSKIVLAWRNHAWKSKRHSDGQIPFDAPNWFIVGVETPNGQATYHYEIDKYWDLFDCKELEQAPDYDGHTPQDAIERIGSLALDTLYI